jgi:hypothetical protein
MSSNRDDGGVRNPSSNDEDQSVEDREEQSKGAEESKSSVDEEESEEDREERSKDAEESKSNSGGRSGKVVYTKYITLKNGKRIYASQYGLEAFRFEV